MKINHRILINFGILVISASLGSTAFAKNKKPKKTVENIQNEQVLAEDPNVVRHADTKAIILKSKNAVIIDFETGETLLEKNARERIIPASMTKIMTSYLIE